MKMVTKEFNTVMGHEVAEADFAIGDMGIIMSILSSKIYSNSVKTICQEVMSNARDAHREIGKGSVPIEVKLPNSLDKTFHIKDFGPGISPDRMANVFICYGTSTKRDSNNQTGGFGLGAKSPFSYTDSFGIITVTPEHQFVDHQGVCHENCLVRRQYVAIRGDKGKMTLQSAEVTNELQGTTIVIACKPGDEGKFKQYVRETAQFWETKPTIRGDANFKWKDFSVQIEGNKDASGNYVWRIDNRDGDYQSNTNCPLAIVDGITYPINYSNLYKDNSNTDTDIYTFMQYPVRLFFATGEIQMTANREEIDYQPSVIDTLRKRINSAVKELRQQLGDKIKGAKNLWDANCQWAKLLPTFGQIVKKVEWKDSDGKMIEVNASSLYLRDYNATVYVFTKNSADISRRNNFSISFTADSILAVEDNDVKVPSKLRIATLFDQNPTAKTVQVLTFTGAEKKDVDDAKEKIEKGINLSKLCPVYLSTIPKKAVVRNYVAGSGGSKVTAKIKKFTNASYKSDVWKDDDTIDIENDSGVYVELRGRDAFVPETTIVLEQSTLQYIAENLKITIYGVHTRYLKAVGEDFVKINDRVQEELNKLFQDKELKEYGEKIDNASNSMQHQFTYVQRLITKDKSKALNLLDKTDSLFKKYFEISEVVSSLQAKTAKINHYKIVCPDVAAAAGATKKETITDIHNDFVKKYPLMVSLNTWQVDGLAVKDLMFYINACDAV